MSYPNQRFAILDGDQLKLVTLEQWAEWIGSHRAQRIIGREVIDGYVVSTIFLGLDYQQGRDGHPLYWETRVFEPLGRKRRNGPLRYLGDQMYAVWYSTAKEARAGHAEAVEWLKEQLRK